MVASNGTTGAFGSGLKMTKHSARNVSDVWALRETSGKPRNVHGFLHVLMLVQGKLCNRSSTFDGSLTRVAFARRVAFGEAGNTTYNFDIDILKPFSVPL